MFRVPLITGSTLLSENDYWSAVFLYHNLPHLINRRILDVAQLLFVQIKFKDCDYQLQDVFSYAELESQFNRLKSFTRENITVDIIKNILELNTNNFVITQTNFEDVKKSDAGSFISVRILFPRNSNSEKSVEIVIINKSDNLVTFSAISKSKVKNITPSFSYDVELERSGMMKICVGSTELAELKTSAWLVETLFPKLMSWAEKTDDNLPIRRSLSLISTEKYCHLYHDLKLKYGEELVRKWSENTDPKKFVYEDIAIATYLLLLWKQITDSKQTYVDLGCGNGLLVYILNQEGHNGYGIDVRARKIWDMYPKSTVLKVETIIPSSTTIFPEADWLIGNHSDELTPWIPVMAARSSQTCKFFLLPCCSYEFSGKKYQRVNSARSVYSEYLDYIKDIIETCDFECEIDRLRIPSTKRTCLIGRKKKTYNNFANVDRKITELINERCNKENKNWVDDYEARKETEAVRNCTKLDKTLTQNIVSKVFKSLLLTENYLMTNYGKKWNAGGNTPLCDVVKMIPTEELKQLKKECGGLQTLLRNHHYIFQVVDGKVQLRVPVIKQFLGTKYKKCWFYINHPDGCFLNEDNCTFIH